MPRTLKRGSNAISRDDGDESDASTPPGRRATQAQSQRKRRRSTPASGVSRSDNEDDEISENDGLDTETVSKAMTKKLVRLALSCEFGRQPIRRADINAKILKAGEGGAAKTQRGINFKTVFNNAQTTLRTVFGMEMIDLPSRERMGLNDRRKAASQKATQKESQKKSQAQRELDGEPSTQARGRDAISSAQNWILVSTLPVEYRIRPELLIPGRAPDNDTESTYVGLVGAIVAILYLHMPSGESSTSTDTQKNTEDQTEPISDARFMRFLSRLALRDYTPMGTDGAITLEKTLARMLREGYIDKRKDSSGGEEVVEWVVGPRAKKEFGRQAVAAMVRAVYGFGLDGSGSGNPRAQADADNASDDEANDQVPGAVKMERAEMERRLKRTLGDVVALKINDAQPDGTDEHEMVDRAEASNARRANRDADESRTPRRSGRRRGHDDDEG